MGVWMSEKRLLTHEELKEGKFHKPIRNADIEHKKSFDPPGTIRRLDYEQSRLHGFLYHDLCVDYCLAWLEHPCSKSVTV